MYDVLIKGARVIDPAQNIDDELDIAISEGRIALLEKDIPAESQSLVNARGKIATPGLIDLHCHVYDGFSQQSVAPDIAGVQQGVTTVVDAGSAGEATFGGFPKYIVPSSKTTIFCFINIGADGGGWDAIKPDALANVIESNRNLIKGIKILFKGKFMAGDGIEVVKTAKKIAGKFNLPIMVHIGDPGKCVSSSQTRQMLNLFDAGDILTHMFTAKSGSMAEPDGSIAPELKEAKKRGVILDSAVDRNNFCFAVARQILAAGILPTTLSTDLNGVSFNTTCSLTVTMSRFMALGLDLRQVVEMTTINPARAIGIEGRAGSLKPGMAADISILEQINGVWQLGDSEDQYILIDSLLVPDITVKSGQVIKAKLLWWPEAL